MKATTAATWAALAIGVAIGPPSRRARAEGKADSGVEISATDAKDPNAVIDPELRPLEQKLKQPPFGSWNTFHPLSWVNKTLVRITAAVSAGAAAALAIVLRPAPANTGDAHGAASPGDPIEVRPVSQRAPGVVESLHVSDGISSVVQVHDEDGNATVIWVTPADTVDGI